FGVLPGSTSSPLRLSTFSYPTDAVQRFSLLETSAQRDQCFLPASMPVPGSSGRRSDEIPVLLTLERVPTCRLFESALSRHRPFAGTARSLRMRLDWCMSLRIHLPETQCCQR